ncbi:hypothetical protein FA13DRAFT_723375 [Coprinellus micaceus]|uniref:BTB domain-containing protein n=1 Tax=Coprinellus micaceus TaxID=71717 RepID=A0A4Y7TV81_COPMI|nr:hypothetical protein FA13DRAFT_723375 [Coprinellus micaceus]
MASSSKNDDLGALRMNSEQTALKDEVYYWLDNARFLVQGVLFRVPRLPFILGSRYFTERHGLRHNTNSAEPIIHLQSVSAAHFRVFLSFLFPMPTNTPLESRFTKEEWVTILRLCTEWHFPEFRKLAIQNLAGKLMELELIHVGREFCIPVFVLEGYRAVIDRPKAKIIGKEDAASIGYESANKLWAIRYQIQIVGVTFDEEALDRELHESFAEELAELRRYKEEGYMDPEDNFEWADAGEEAGNEEEGPPEHPIWMQSVSGGPPPETERVRLTRSIENLKEEERQIMKRLQEVQLWDVTPEATENLAKVTKARKEAVPGGERLRKSLDTINEMSTLDLWSLLEEPKGRREWREQHHQDTKGEENGQPIKWKQEGKADKEMELAKLSEEILQCQRKRWEVEGQLKKLDQPIVHFIADACRRRK